MIAKFVCRALQENGVKVIEIDGGSRLSAFVAGLPGARQLRPSRGQIRSLFASAIESVVTEQRCPRARLCSHAWTTLQMSQLYPRR